MSYEETLQHFEDIEVGSESISRARTITEAEITLFAGISGDHNPAHLNEEYASKTPEGKRTAHPLLGIAIASGLKKETPPPAVMAFLGMEMNFLKPIYIGDTIYTRTVVSEKHETSKGDRGIVTFKRELINQKGEVLQEGRATIMVRRREPTITA